MIDNAIKVKELVGREETLRILAPVFGWDEPKIQTLLAQVSSEQANALASLAGNMPTFGNFGTEFTTPLTTGQRAAAGA